VRGAAGGANAPPPADRGFSGRDADRGRSPPRPASG
jgi:hypothetical protein